MTVRTRQKDEESRWLPPDWIYLSPHLDDVALSCGGQIARLVAAGQRVWIVTVMAGDPPTQGVSAYAQSLHQRWELAMDAVAGRRQEDVAACAILGTDYQHWTVPDCIYRYHPETGDPFYVSDDDIFGEVHPAEQGLVETLAREMARLPALARVVAPLTVGHHVDHQIVRAAAEKVLAPSRLFYYEDYPYAQEAGKLEAALSAGDGPWEATVIPLDERALQRKIEAIAAFRSQLSTFFVDRADLARQVRGYAAAVGGERLWRRVSGKAAAIARSGRPEI
ncbi:PIG-L family deacetylase [Litorilinea aerophila]|uniref:PIG-L family deacetylase n=1 Tax=Litorilinea aerophila TaxID=1204385 RepID=A0A540VAC2_9CHLR|nr:PIG-L family deacetylase [Litorilinea aerophila]MCC9078411.1 PIG-L family deacetylase [Litorilinea aerophila]GIV76053.1 MAG: GlcNAc-PI de-N-acetylase [Litorilinea sp.]